MANTLFHSAPSSRSRPVRQSFQRPAGFAVCDWGDYLLGYQVIESFAVAVALPARGVGRGGDNDHFQFRNDD